MQNMPVSVIGCPLINDSQNDKLFIVQIENRFRPDYHWLNAQFSSVTQSYPTLCDPMDCSTPGLRITIINSRTPPKPMSIELIMPSNYLILCCPLLFPPSIFPSIRVFSNESVLHIRWPKYWIISINISPSNEYSGMISSKIDWFDLLEVQVTLKSLLQHHSSSINSSALSFLYGPTLTSIHDYWKKHSFEETDFCWQSKVSAF